MSRVESPISGRHKRRFCGNATPHLRTDRMSCLWHHRERSHQRRRFLREVLRQPVGHTFHARVINAGRQRQRQRRRRSNRRLWPPLTSTGLHQLYEKRCPSKAIDGNVASQGCTRVSLRRIAHRPASLSPFSHTAVEFNEKAASASEPERFSRLSDSGGLQGPCF